MDSFPSTLIIHGRNDSVVPMESSVHFWDSLQSAATPGNSCRIDLEVLPEVGHADVITQIMFGGVTRDTILNWMRQNEG